MFILSSFFYPSSENVDDNQCHIAKTQQLRSVIIKGSEQHVFE